MRLAAALILAAAQAQAGAWTQAQGDAFVSFGGGWYRAGDFEEYGASAYAEVGVLPWLTVAAALEGEFPRGGEGADLLGAAFVRARLWEGPQGDPFSVQLGFIGPLGDAVDVGVPQLDREEEIDARALYGRGFSSALGPGWVGVEGGARFRLGDSADELRLDLTAGVRPAEDWLVFVQSFNTLGLRNNAPFGGDYDAFKLAPSVGYRLTETTTVVLGVERDVAGRNIDFGTRVRASFWLTF